jgi:hypothetical protein
MLGKETQRRSRILEFNSMKSGIKPKSLNGVFRHLAVFGVVFGLLSSTGCEPCTCCAGSAVAAKVVIDIAVAITAAVAADKIIDEMEEGQEETAEESEADVHWPGLATDVASE